MAGRAGASQDPRYPWLVLAAAPGVGPKTVERLAARFGGATQITAAGPVALAEAGLSPAACEAIIQPDHAALAASLAWADGDDAHLVTRDDGRYPPQLAEIADAPLLLYVRGDVTALSDPQIAIVGSRTPTPQGREATRELAGTLAARGLTITSGLAAGVDGAAHEGALASGRTIAVLGTGPDLVYPAEHRELAHRIVASGALVSEYPPGLGPRPAHFPRRNRLIAGLSLGALVTEAAERSGSLITARLAAEQGREVFAVPGSIRNPRARGCHMLIRQGAKLVETADDILVELAPLLRGILQPESMAPLPSPSSASAGELDEDYLHLLESMGYDPVAPDELIARSGLPAAAVSSMLLLLELQGYVSSCPGGRYCRDTGRAVAPAQLS
ncbi:DNA protecting protein DprA [Thioflavicoccus mobilis 8321]|uniref:DNA protecting protein DprA n=1 Tax=Thioflavicoccus mobilis 8321 TaxID=765912 RepID=L0GVQ6_9GAMM|nr:DNA-processing protein DprA [Thioflavicoccus mobilis]AGA90046.1 DNA protecting protein DprA [Thioflavicoccus mobilis 8321]